MLAVGCTNSVIPPVTPSITITPPEQNRIRFTGKGAGAGMMLMSSMGPMGMAVGVAIDEGIAKEVNETLDGTGHDLLGAFTTEIRQMIGDDSNFTSLEIIVDRYGFKTAVGDNDPCMVDIQMRFSINGGRMIAVSSSDVYAVHGPSNTPVKSLATLKDNAESSIELYQEFARDLVVYMRANREGEMSQQQQIRNK